jgi:CheY-like chemotaxis protein
MISSFDGCQTDHSRVHYDCERDVWEVPGSVPSVGTVVRWHRGRIRGSLILTRYLQGRADLARWKVGTMRVLLAATHPQFRWALRTVLGEEPALTVVGEVSTSRSLLSQAKILQPELLLVDWDLLEKPQARALAALHNNNAQCGILVISEQPESKEAALSAGADAFLCKCDPPDQFLATLRALLRECEVAGPKSDGR